MRLAFAPIAAVLFACGVADTGVLLCPAGTTSTANGCQPMNGGDGGTVPDGPVRIERAPVRFGRAAVGGDYIRPIVLVNDGDTEEQVTFSGGDPGRSFQVLGLRPGEAFVLQPGERRPLMISFIPRGAGARSATFTFLVCDGPGCTRNVEVTGTSVLEAFRCENPYVGVVLPGECRLHEPRCVNDTDYPLTLAEVMVSGDPGFVVLSNRGEVGPGMQAMIDVEYCAPALGEAVATLHLIAATTGGPNISRFELHAGTREDGFLQCDGPSVALSAPVGGLDRVRVPCRIVGETTIFNVGFDPLVTPELEAAVRVLGAQMPLPIAVLEGEPIEVELTFRPLGPGRYTTNLLVGFEGGNTGFEVSAVAEEMGGCALDFLPFVDFGLVGLGQAATAGSIITNVGFGPCSLETLGLTPNSDPSFSVLSPPPGSVSFLQPGDSLEATFRFEPQGAGPRGGTYQFRVPEIMGGIQQIDLAGVGGTQQITCGDGMLDPGELCDDGNPLNHDACVECAPAACGDGFLQIGIEQCDQGNLMGGGACGPMCGWTVPAYAVSWVPAAPVAPLGGTIMFGNQDDDSTAVSIGFPFVFAGIPAPVAHVGTNGLIGFGSSAGIRRFINEAIPSTQEPNAMLAWWWTDLITQAMGATVTTTISGAPPNRVRSFSFVNLPGFGGNQTPIVTARVDLFEGSNVIEVHYGTIFVRNPGVDFGASVGFEGPGGTYGQDVLGCTPTCTSAHWPSNMGLRYTPTF